MTKQQQQELMKTAESIAGSLPKLASALGVNSSTAYRWMHGTRRMHGISVRAVQGYINERRDDA